MFQLKLKSLKARLFVIIYIALFCVTSIRQAIPLIQRAQVEPRNLTGAEIELYPPINLSVSGTICFIYDCYFEQKISSNYHHKEYIVDVGANRYIRLLAVNKMIEKTDALQQATKDYQNGLISYEELASKQIPFTGVIGGSGSNESWRNFQTYMESLNLSFEERVNYVPTCIHPDGPDDSIKKWVILAGISALILLFLLIVIFSGYHQRAIKKYIKSHPIPAIAKEKVDDFLKKTPEYHNLRLNHEFICGQRGATTIFGDIHKLKRVYVQARKNKYYFLTISTSYLLVLYFEDGNIERINVKKEAYAYEHMQKLSALVPNMEFGTAL